MRHIKFNYLYRDAGNYKNFGYVVFSNDHNVPINIAEKSLRSKLIDAEYFYTDKWQIPDLHFAQWNNELDHDFHEFDSLEFTDEAPSIDEDFTRWLSAL